MNTINMVIRKREYNKDGSRIDRNPLTRTIIGVDGEGWNIPLSNGITSANPHVAERGWHSYVMLAAADDNGRRKVLMHDGLRRESLTDVARNYGLPTDKSCEFLLSLPQDAVIVGFYFSYDATKILGADLPLANIRELCNEDFIPQDEYNARVHAIAQQFGMSVEYIHKARLVSTASTVYHGYLIRYTPRKKLEIIDLSAGRIQVCDKYWSREVKGWQLGKPRSEWKRSVTVWDVFGFFQKSFVSALKDYRCAQCEPCKHWRTCKACKADNCELGHCAKALWSRADLKRIESMKESRGVFDPGQQQEIADYCVDECRYLSFLVRDLLTHVDAFGLKLNSFHGSGAIASSWLTDKGIKKSLPMRTAIIGPDGLPEFFLAGLPETIALSGYFGGRFEISEMGFMGSLYSYDINSAYPAITVTLPCLAHGWFVRVSEYVPGAVGVYLAGSRTSGRYAPFPFRTASEPVNGVAKDAIYYAHGGQRWIWQDEIRMARKHFGADAIPIYDGYIWQADGCDCDPFADIDGMYKTRQQYVIDGNGVEKVIKLILNSLYGKTAQSIGWNISKTGEKIPPPFQCFIWAALITSGCRAMILDAIMQHDADVVSIATDGILSRSPIAGIDAPKEKILGKWEASKVTDGWLFQSGVYTYTNDKGKRKYATRGFAAKEIPADTLINAFQSGQYTVNADPAQSRFIPMKSGIMRDDPLEYIGQWIPSEHDVNFTHNRRLPLPTFDEFGIPDFSAFNPCSEPHMIAADMISSPYVPKQTWEDVMENQMPPDQLDYMEI
jgi:hypothetical protein